MPLSELDAQTLDAALVAAPFVVAARVAKAVRL